MQYISSEGLLIDTINKEVRILGSTNTISSNSVAFLGETSVIANSSIGFGGSNNIANNDAIIFGGYNNNINDSLAFSTTNSIISGDSIDFNSNNIKSEEGSISFNTNNTSLTASIGLKTTNDTLNNNSIAFLSKNNNVDSSVIINGDSNVLNLSSIAVLTSNSNLNSKSVLFNSLSTTADLSGVGINADFSFIKDSSLAINTTNDSVTSNSISFLGSKNVVNNNSINLNSLSSNIQNNSIGFSTQNSDINTNSLGINSVSSNVLDKSINFNSFGENISLSSLSVNGKENNITITSLGINTNNSNLSNKTLGINSSNSTINDESLGLNLVNSTIKDKSLGINLNSSNLQLSSFGFSSNNSSLSGTFFNNINNVQANDALVLNSSNSQISSSFVLFGNNNKTSLNSGIIKGSNNTLTNESIAIQSNSNNLDNNVFVTLTENLSAKNNAVAFNSSNGILSSNSVQINGNNNIIENKSVSIEGNSNTVLASSVNIASDNNKIYDRSININGFTNTVSAKSISFNTNSSNLTNNAVSLNSFNSNVSSNSLSINSQTVSLNLSSTDILGQNNTVTNKSFTFGSNNTVAQNNSLSFNSSNTTVSANSVVLGGNNNQVHDYSFVINSSGSNAFKGSSVIGGRGTTASLSSVSVGSLNTQIAGDNSLVLGGSGHNLNSSNSVFLGGQDNYAANTPSGSLKGNQSIILGGQANRTGSKGIVIGGSNNDAQNTSIIISGSGNNTGNFKNVVIIGRDNITASQDNVVYLPEINALGNLTITGDVTATGTFTRVDTVTGNVSAFNVSNYLYPLVPLTVDQNYIQDNTFDTARFSFYNSPRLGVTSQGVGINTFDRVTDQALTVAGNLSATGNAKLEGTLNIGPDVNLYRSATNTLKTDDNLNVGTLATGSSNNVITQTSNTLQQRQINERVWDTNATFLSGSPTNNKIVKAFGDKRLVDSVITDNGTNIGIGTDSPSEALHISRTANSSIRLGQAGGNFAYRLRANVSSTVNGGFLIEDPESGNDLYKTISGAAGSHSFSINNVEVMHINSAGSVGIGTTSPNEKLTVIGNISASGAIELQGGTSDANGIQFGTDTNLYRSAANTLKTDDEFEISNAGGKDTLKLTNTGTDTGITIGGDTNIYRSAANTLKTDDNLIVGTLAANTNSNSIVVENSGKLEKRTLNAGVWNTTAPYVSATSANSFTTNQVLKAANGAGITNSIISDNGTSVGINTTNPQNTLTIKASSNVITNYPVRINNSADNYAFAIGAYGVSNRENLSNLSIDYTVDIGDDLIIKNSGSENIRIKGSGNVGIGTTSPNEKLTVIGNVSSTGALMLNSGLTRDNGVQFGTDVSIYRSGVDQLQTDDTLYIGLSTIVPNMTKPTNETSNDVIVRNVGGTLFRREINPIIWNTTATFLSADASPTINALQKYRGSNSVEDSIIIDNGTNIGINTGTTPLGARLTINGTISSNNTITTLGDINGTAALKLAAGTTQTNGIQFGTDTNVYRSAANTLRTDDNLSIGTLATSTANAVVTHVAGVLQQRNINTRVWDTAATFLSGSSLTLNRVAKISGPNSIANTNITDDGTTTTIAGTNFAFKNTSKVVDLFNGATNYFRFDHSTNGVLKFAYNNSNDFEVNGASSYIYTPNQLLINTTTTGDYKLRVNGTSQFDGAAVFASTITTSAEPLIRNTNLRIGTATHSTIFHQNNSDFYVLYGTNANAGNNYNSLRPFRINNATGDVYLANNNILARHSDGKLLVGSSEVMTAATWASLAPAGTPLQMVHDADNAVRGIISKTLYAARGLGVNVTTRKANSNFLLKAVLHHTDTYVMHFGFMLRLGFNDVITTGAFTKAANTTTVQINFGTPHGLEVNDVVVIDNPPSPTTAVIASFKGYSSFRVLSVPNANTITIESSTTNGATAISSAAGTGSRIYKWRLLGLDTANGTGTTGQARTVHRSQATRYTGTTTTDVGKLVTTAFEYYYNPGTVEAGTLFTFDAGCCSTWGANAYTMYLNNRSTANNPRYDMRSESTITVTELAG